MSKVHARSKSSKLSARKLPKTDATPVDRRLLAQAAREDGEATPSPVGVRAADRGNAPFPMTLDRVCDLVGNDVDPRNFVATAFEAIARDIDGLSTLAEHESSQAGFDGWCMFQHLAKRARLAAEVAAFIDSDDAEVQP